MSSSIIRNSWINEKDLHCRWLNALFSFCADLCGGKSFKMLQKTFFFSSSLQPFFMSFRHIYQILPLHSCYICKNITYYNFQTYNTFWNIKFILFNCSKLNSSYFLSLWKLFQLNNRHSYFLRKTLINTVFFSFNKKLFYHYMLFHGQLTTKW